ncbi:helix-turn-helix transcriptional regulator [Pseudonocardia sp. KRD-184]|uniref:Helix-turn-helix transcriptional regulator n=1 Tax=Pseudonocardia oceani TaxID=2792013 RepID=A0ABS6UCM3_9PSEU|nr:helix-turn-helix transcriptional regulator [Pseudonocardia oceani]MBW0090853.1 helix-turn-helix transcriptional regulator [Pseudonocardia oceani]MBW0098436.1 helix-turn-helix transcriptional regulator [Pseudonocardia oceani]MBW0110992.1 helix-turn-helix transcriptional regulator [Pseudonocardia oceani]MBW0121759.1 helix-turn-helix transcriptional regulator [Pseudonocardia oceani]MBW0129919.1 helix-turn-helix transcriptional regulator [Pseudonocardia oceani]
MRSYREDELRLAETATSPGTPSVRAHALLEALRRLVPFDGAWLALADPLGRGYHSLACVDVDVPTVERLSGALVSRTALAERPRPAPPLPEPPHPPSPFPEAVGIDLVAPAGRRVGFLALLPGFHRPSSGSRRRLGRLAPVLARGIDPMRSLLGAAHLVHGATAGAVLCADGGCRPLPDLPVDPLLDPRSAVLAAAHERIDDGRVHSSFLWPLGGPHAPDGHVRVTVLAAPEDVPPGLTGLALLSPVADLHGLTPREIEVLGLLVEGCSNQEIARALVVAPRTVAAHLEHILGKLGAPARTLAAVRAEREGLYVPRQERHGG